MITCSIKGVLLSQFYSVQFCYWGDAERRNEKVGCPNTLLMFEVDENNSHKQPTARPAVWYPRRAFAPGLHTMNLENILPRHNRSNSVLEGTNSTEGEENVILGNIHISQESSKAFVPYVVGNEGEGGKSKLY